MKKEDPKTPPQPIPQESVDKSTETLESPGEGLDFAKLDLTIEKVDERLSPSETNIFDK